MKLTAQERAALAAKVRISEPYLYQCLTGRKDMNPAEAVRVERESGGLVCRWHLRTSDWRDIWPEVVGPDGEPLLKQAA